jgi:hypothetical protein
LLAIAGIDLGGRLPTEAVRPGGSKKRELIGSSFDEGGKPSKVSLAKVN